MLGGDKGRYIKCGRTKENTVVCQVQDGNKTANAEVGLDSNKEPTILNIEGDTKLLDDELPKIMKRIKVKGADDFQPMGEH